jgi:hypothetical protein
MTVANLRQFVEPPSFTARSFGLLDVLDIRSPRDPHWQNGVTYESVCGLADTTFDDCVTVTGSGVGQPVPPSPPKADTTGGLNRRGATPFTVFAEVDCSVPGFFDRAELTVETLLTHTESWQVERTFWTGVAGGQSVVFPHLAANAVVTDESNVTLQTAATSVTGSGVVLDVVEAVGLLEQQMADCYVGVPVIHATVRMAAQLAEANLLVRDGPRYRTPAGSLVVLGGGYRGTGPDGTSAFGSEWMYATGAMFAYRGRWRVIPATQSIDRAENTVKAIAERTYVIGWECCHLAARVTTGGVIAGAPASAS